MSAPLAGPGGWSTTPARSRSRVFYWFFLAVQLLFVVVLVVGLAIGLAEGSGTTATGDEFGSLSTAVDRAASLAIAAVVLATWFVVNSFLAITYWTYRKARDL